MKVLIIEDEKPAYESITQELHALNENVQVVAICNTVHDSVSWLDKNPQPDLILKDIQLSDGLSFCIFKSSTISCPVIFTTAYDKYLTEAFDYNGIDYLL